MNKRYREIIQGYADTQNITVTELHPETKTISEINVAYICPTIGKEEGDICNRDGCEGEIEIYQETCYCNAGNAPCLACENAHPYCPECGWDPNEDGDIDEDAQ